MSPRYKLLLKRPAALFPDLSTNILDEYTTGAPSGTGIDLTPRFFLLGEILLVFDVLFSPNLPS
jgi:hypothetical protein